MVGGFQVVGKLFLVYHAAGSNPSQMNLRFGIKEDFGKTMSPAKAQRREVQRILKIF
jgi:hypothetical protein